MEPTLLPSLLVQLLCIYSLVKSQYYLGCYEDIGSRVLAHHTYFAAMTPAMCVDYCQRLGYKYAGLQFRTDCYCGVQNPSNMKRKESDCDIVCNGNKTEICGGTWRNSVYRIENPKRAYEYLGCYKDETTPRALSGFYTTFNNMAPNDCIETCKGLGYLYAGLQYGGLCWCGNEFDQSFGRPEQECDSRCSGDSNRICGGAWRNTMYRTGNGGKSCDNPCNCPETYSGTSSEYLGKSCDYPSAPLNAVKSCSYETCTITCLEDYVFPDGSTTVNISCISGSWKPARSDWQKVPNCKVKFQEYMGCYVDSGDRMLSHSTTFTAQTPDMCIDYCQKVGYSFAGLQARTYCFCGVEAPDRLKTYERDCNNECPGNSAEKCGGSWRNSVYKITYPKKGYEYLGCYKDQDNPRAFSGYYKTLNNMFPFQCITFCKTLGYAYAGLQAGSLCYCGNKLQPTNERVAESECNSRCSGDPQKICGGGWRNSVYFTGACTTPCQNGGTCLFNNTCECSANFYGELCQYKYCAGYPSTPANSVKSCDSKKCSFVCLDNYKFPDGSTKVEILCQDGSWGTAIPDCKATCTSPCQNGGTCVSPNTCACTENFYGPTCESKRCSTYPPMPANSIKSCDTEKCTITCLDNYKFSDGSVTVQILCKNGTWDPTPSDCKAPFVNCTSLCQNGGVCLSSGICACPQNVYGPTCERKGCVGYPPTPENSTKSCDSERCTITCLQKYEFPGMSTTANVSCIGGVWVPATPNWSRVPDCKENLKEYVGCYEEAVGSKMMGHARVFNNLTTEICTDYCRTLGYSYFGTQYRSECFCGDYLPDIKMKVNDSKCDLTCPGNNAQKCGSSGRNSLYKILNPLKAYAYVGCYTDDSEPRLLKDYYKYYERLLPFQCTEYCKEQGSAYAGLLAGFRCFCGTRTLPSEKKVAEDKCNTRCAGDIYKLCGGNSTSSIYATGL